MAGVGLATYGVSVYIPDKEQKREDLILVQKDGLVLNHLPDYAQTILDDILVLRRVSINKKHSKAPTVVYLTVDVRRNANNAAIRVSKALPPSQISVQTAVDGLKLFWRVAKGLSGGSSDSNAGFKLQRRTSFCKVRIVAVPS